MFIEIAPYTLKGRFSFCDQEGVLIRIDHLGVSVFHPWPSLGHDSLKQQLQWLKQGRVTPHLRRALEIASIDKQAREGGRALFSEKPFPKSHTLIPNQIGYTTAKVKVRPDTLFSIEKFLDYPILRLDCNARFSEATIEQLMKYIQPIRERIEFIEDPFPFSKTQWMEVEEKYGIPLASDWEGRGEWESLVVYKPGFDKEIPICQKLVVTSLLDHPLGQVQAAFFAAHSGTELLCGLTSHEVYEPNSYSDRLMVNEGQLQLMDRGRGFGFDDLLAKEKWSVLCDISSL